MGMATNLKITADHSFLSLPDDPHDPAEQHVNVFGGRRGQTLFTGF